MELRVDCLACVRGWLTGLVVSERWVIVSIYSYDVHGVVRIQLRSYGPSLEEERVWGRRRERLRCGHIRGPVGRRCSRGEGGWSPR